MGEVRGGWFYLLRGIACVRPDDRYRVSHVSSLTVIGTHRTTHCWHKLVGKKEEGTH